MVRRDVMRAFSRLINRLLFAISLNAERTKVESGKRKRERKATTIRKMKGKREKEKLIVDKENESLQYKDKLKKKNMLT